MQKIYLRISELLFFVKSLRNQEDPSSTMPLQKEKREENNTSERSLQRDMFVLGNVKNIRQL